ncbi:SMP-30/gluconolactonase/LRE family protein [Kordia jejudonensis]|uniref:SMP-30/gluconolactonase/LRE family protein n=1 Tax=Kordia jejudonensis TaxID=1348245 RepID=UPI00069B86D3|nr:hypothetical protein [Kordia jejudonensis]
MKTFFKIILLTSLFFACKTEKKSPEQTPEKEVVAIKMTPKLIHEINGLTHCESVVYDKKRNVYYASLIGNREQGDGSIAKVGADGKLIDSIFIKGLNDPKGIAITADKLYVSDVTVLVEADLNSGKVIKTHTTEGTQFLNDVSIAKDGTIYISDTRKSSIFALTTDGTFSEWLQSEALEHPNGLLNVGNDMYVAAWGNVVGEGDTRKQSGNFLKLNMKTKEITKVSKDTLGNLDGVQIYDENSFLISAWNTGKIMKISTEGEVEDIVTVGRSVGDILYEPSTKVLGLPMNIQSQLLLYEFQKAEK